MNDHFLVSYLNGDQHTIFGFGEPIAIAHNFADAKKVLIERFKKRIASAYDDIETELEIAEGVHCNDPEKEHLPRIRGDLFTILGLRRDIRTIKNLREVDSSQYLTIKKMWIVKIPTRINGILEWGEPYIEYGIIAVPNA